MYVCMCRWKLLTQPAATTYFIIAAIDELCKQQFRKQYQHCSLPLLPLVNAKTVLDTIWWCCLNRRFKVTEKLSNAVSDWAAIASDPSSDIGLPDESFLCAFLYRTACVRQHNIPSLKPRMAAVREDIMDTCLSHFLLTDNSNKLVLQAPLDKETEDDQFLVSKDAKSDAVTNGKISGDRMSRPATIGAFFQGTVFTEGYTPEIWMCALRHLCSESRQLWMLEKISQLLFRVPFFLGKQIHLAHSVARYGLYGMVDVLAAFPCPHLHKLISILPAIHEIIYDCNSSAIQAKALSTCLALSAEAGCPGFTSTLRWVNDYPAFWCPALVNLADSFVRNVQTDEKGKTSCIDTLNQLSQRHDPVQFQRRIEAEREVLFLHCKNDASVSTRRRMWNADDCELDTFASKWFNIAFDLVSKPLSLYLNCARRKIWALLSKIEKYPDVGQTYLEQYRGTKFGNDFSATDSFYLLTYRWMAFAVAILCSHQLTNGFHRDEPILLHQILPTYLTDPLVAATLPQLSMNVHEETKQDNPAEDDRLDLSAESLEKCRDQRQKLCSLLLDELKVAAGEDGSVDESKDLKIQSSIPVPFRFVGFHLQLFIEPPSADKLLNRRFAADDSEDLKQQCQRLPLDVSVPYFSMLCSSNCPPLISLQRRPSDVDWPLTPFTDRSAFHSGLFVNELIRTANDIISLVPDDEFAHLRILLFGDDSTKAETICSLLNACYRCPKQFARIRVRLYSLPSPEPGKRSALDEYLAWTDPIFRRQVFSLFRGKSYIVPTVDHTLGCAAAHPQNLNKVDRCNENPYVGEAQTIEHYLRSAASVMPLTVWQCELWYDCDSRWFTENDRSQRVNSLRQAKVIESKDNAECARHADLVVPVVISVEVGMTCNLELVKQSDNILSVSEVVRSKDFRSDGGLSTPAVTLEYVASNPYKVSLPRRPFFVDRTRYTQIKLTNIPSIEDMNARGLQRLSSGVSGQSEVGAKPVGSVSDNEGGDPVQEKWSWPKDEHTEPSDFSLDLRVVDAEDFESVSTLA